MEGVVLFAIILILISLITRYYSYYRIFTGRKELPFRIG